MVAGTLAAQVPPPPEGAPITPALRRLLADGGEVRRVATNFAFADGPIWVDGALVFTDAPRGRVIRLLPEGDPEIVNGESGGARGLAVDAQMRLIAAERHDKRVSRREDGEVAALADQAAGRPLSGPTDVVVTGSGTVYFIDDAGAGAKAGGRVLRVRPDRPAEVVLDSLARPTGLAVDEERHTLYLADAARRELRAYPIGADGAIGEPRRLASIVPWKRGVRGRADGLTLDGAGHIYLAGPGGIWVLDANGGRLGVIATPETPSASAFGGTDGQTLYITAETSLYVVRMTDGVLR